MNRLAKWAVTTATVAGLTGAGYLLGEWDPERGYPVIDGNSDTTWVADSAELANFAVLGHSSLGTRPLGSK